MRFWKYHGLGNDYVVLDPTETGPDLSASSVRAICDRHFGLGSDGILLGPLPSSTSDARLRIFNPDGTEAEKSGNGLRIFARHLWETGQTDSETFAVETLGGLVQAQVANQGRHVTVEMGRVSFNSVVIPVAGTRRDVLDEPMQVGDSHVRFSAATIGNPHCVILVEKASEEETRRLGPLIETDERFPNRTNVQFMEILTRSDIRIEIWERGAGYTLASGSSASAAAAVARRLGLCDGDVAVHMPGGTLAIHIDKDFDVTMSGPVGKVAEGVIADEVFEEMARLPKVGTS